MYHEVPKRQLSPGEVSELKRIQQYEAYRQEKRPADKRMSTGTAFVIRPPKRSYIEVEWSRDNPGV